MKFEGRDSEDNGDNKVTFYVIIGLIISIAIGIIIYCLIQMRKDRKRRENRETIYGIIPKTSYVEGMPLPGDEIIE